MELKIDRLTLDGDETELEGSFSFRLGETDSATRERVAWHLENEGWGKVKTLYISSTGRRFRARVKDIK